MSKKTIAFTMPAGGSSPRDLVPSPARDDPASEGASVLRPVRAPSDDWVRERDLAADPAPAGNAPARVVLDLTTERTLIEVAALSFLVPFALGWYWLINAMSGRAQL